MGADDNTTSKFVDLVFPTQTSVDDSLGNSSSVSLHFHLSISSSSRAYIRINCDHVLM